MYTLGIDTTGLKSRIALLKGEEILYERSWKSNMNEAESMTKTLHSLTQMVPMLFQQLRRIVVVQGPGGFNGTRIGITIANCLLWLTKAKVFPLDTFTFWKRRLTKEQQKIAPHQLIKMTEQEIFLDGKAVLFEEFLQKLKKLKKKEYQAYGQLTPTQRFTLKQYKNFLWIEEENLKSFAHVLKELTAQGRSSMISPIYYRPPVITAAKKKLHYSR